jgi:hypothetical protein
MMASGVLAMPSRFLVVCPGCSLHPALSINYDPAGSHYTNFITAYKPSMEDDIMDGISLREMDK